MKHGPAVLLAILAVLVGGVLVLWVLVVGLKGLQEKIPEYQAALSGLLDGLEVKLADRGDQRGGDSQAGRRADHGGGQTDRGRVAGGDGLRDSLP